MAAFLHLLRGLGPASRLASSNTFNPQASKSARDWFGLPVRFELIDLCLLLLLVAIIGLLSWIIWSEKNMPAIVPYAKGLIVVLLLAFAGWIAYLHQD